MGVLAEVLDLGCLGIGLVDAGEFGRGVCGEGRDEREWDYVFEGVGFAGRSG